MEKMSTMDDSSGDTISSKNGRYSVVFNQSKNFKHVPFEQLDFSIYKATTNTVAYTTSEERMPLWVEALRARYKDGLHNNTSITTRWEESENKDDISKCEKVTIHLISTKNTNGQNLITITAMINHGRIQIQGKSYKEWGDDEFPILLDIVDCGPTKDNPTKNLENFMELITANTKHTATKEKEIHIIEDKSTEDTNDEPVLSNMKCSLASLEADFVLFKQTTQQNINELTVKLSDKEDEINNLRNQITSLKTTNIQQQQSISDLTIKQMQNEDEIKKLHNKHKQLEKKNTTLLQKLQKLPNQKESATDETTNDTQHDIAVSTSNSYNTLKDNPDQPKDDDQPKDKTETPTPQKNQTDQIKESQPKKNDGETIILCDSNGRHLNPNLLCPGSKTSYIRCPTLNEAHKIIEQTNFVNPQTFLIHCGTNDLESNPSDDEIIDQIKTLTANIQKKHSRSRVIISALLPRKDDLDKRTKNINKNLETAFSTKNINVVKHDNIKTEDLRDKKHLNTIGVKRFALNLKRAYFGHPPRTSNKSHLRQKHHMRQPMTYRWQPNQVPNQQTSLPLPPFHQSPSTIHQNANQFHPNHPLYNQQLHNQHTSHKDQEGRLPQEMVQLIKLLHTRYVN
jgi:hypothetical protein